MKPQNILLFLFFLTQSITLSAQQYLPSFQEIKNHKTIQLDNGFTILNVSTSNQDTVYFHFASRLNPSTNQKYTTNIFFIQQLFGFYTSKMTIGDLNALKQTLQIEHARKGTEIYLSGNTTNSDTLLHVLSLLATQPIIKQASFDSLKRKELEIIEANKTIIDSVASIFLRKDYFANKHFLGNTADAASIKQVTNNLNTSNKADIAKIDELQALVKYQGERLLRNIEQYGIRDPELINKAEEIKATLVSLQERLAKLKSMCNANKTVSIDAMVDKVAKLIRLQIASALNAAYS